MMPILSLSFRPTSKSPTYCTPGFVYCAATFWYYPSKGGNQQQGSRAHGRQWSICRAAVLGAHSLSQRRLSRWHNNAGQPAERASLGRLRFLSPSLLSSHLQESDKSEEGRLSSSSSIILWKKKLDRQPFIKRSGLEPEGETFWETTSWMVR